MHPKNNADELVLEVLPNGQPAWLKPERERNYILPARYWLTDLGRRYLAEQHALDHGPI